MFSRRPNRSRWWFFRWRCPHGQVSKKLLIPYWHVYKQASTVDLISQYIEIVSRILRSFWVKAKTNLLLPTLTLSL